MGAVKASRGTIFVLAQNAAQFGIGLLFFAIVAQNLEKAEIGLISTFTFISVLFIAIAPLSLQIAAARYIAEFLGKNSREKAASVANTVRKWVFSVSLVIIILGFIVTLFLFPSYPVNPIQFALVLVYGFFSTMRITHQAFLQGLQKFERYALVGTISLLISRGLGIILVLLGYGLLGVFLGWVIGEVIGTFLAILFYRGLLPKTNTFFDYKLLLSFSLPVLFMTAVNTVSDWTDRILLFTDLENLGIYELVIRGSSTLFLIWTALNTVLLPLFSESYGHSGYSDMTRLSKEAIKYWLYLIAPASLGLAAISRSAMALLFGWEYTAGSASLGILALFSIFNSLSILASTILQAIRKTDVFLKITLTTVVVNLIASIILVPRFGINGAAVARATMMMTSFIYTFSVLRREISIEVDGSNMFKAIIASLLMAIPLLLFDTFSSGTIIMNVVLSVAIELALGISLYLVSMLALKALSKRDFELVKKMVPQSLIPILNRFERFFT